MSGRIVRIIVLVAAWMVLWRDISWANLLSGLLVATLVTSFFGFTTERAPKTVRPIHLVRYLAAFSWSVIKANLFIAWEVVTPTNTISEGVIAVELRTDDPILVSIISHSIGLAPGTMVIDVQQNPTVIFVHSLHMKSFEAERAAVRHLEQLVRAAFDPTADPREVVS